MTMTIDEIRRNARVLMDEAQAAGHEMSLVEAVARASGTPYAAPAPTSAPANAPTSTTDLAADIERRRVAIRRHVEARAQLGETLTAAEAAGAIAAQEAADRAASRAIFVRRVEEMISSPTATSTAQAADAKQSSAQFIRDGRWVGPTLQLNSGGGPVTFSK